jgi:hypothetical protein
MTHDELDYALSQLVQSVDIALWFGILVVILRAVVRR